MSPSYGILTSGGPVDEDTAIVEGAFPELFQAGVYEHARLLGIDPATEPDLMWIARESLVAPLPHGWSNATASETGEPYYYNTESGESRWDHPCDDQFRQLVHEYRHRQSFSESVGGTDMHTASYYEQQHLRGHSSHGSAWQEEYASSEYHGSSDVWTQQAAVSESGEPRQGEYEYTSTETEVADTHSTLVASGRQQYVRGADDTEIVALQARLEELEGTNRQLVHEREEGEALVMKLEQHSKQLVQDIEDYESRVKDLVTMKEKTVLEATVRDLKAVVEDCEQHMTQLKEANVQLKQELSEHKQCAGEQGKATENEELVHVREQVKTLKQALENEQGQQAQGQHEVETLQAKLDAGIKELESAWATIKKLEGDLRRKERKEQEESSVASATAAAALAAAQSKAETVAADLATKEQALTIAQGEAHRLQAELASIAQQHLHALDSATKAYEERLSTREAELVATKNDLATSQKKLRSASEDKAALENKLDQQVKVAAMQQANAEDQQRTLKRDIRVLERDLKAMQAVSKEREDELMATKRLVASLEQRLQDHDTLIATAKRTGYEEAKEAAADLIRQAQADKARVAELYSQELLTRRKLHNRLMELQGNIRVFCRVRPIQAVELTSEQSSQAIFFRDNDAESLDLVVGGELGADGKLLHGAGQKHGFEFDHVFQPTSTQADVFEQTKALVTSALDGFNVCIFAYGQTGSGKTHTMEGSESDRGLNYRSLEELFKIREERTATGNFECTMKLSILEVYNETIVDLLDKTSASNVDQRKGLEIRMSKTGVYVENLIEMEVFTEKDVGDLLKIGRKNRTVGSHDVNEHSSRSHLVLSIAIETLQKIDNKRRVSKLHLIDLAGSERVGKTSASGIRLKEAQNINRSLSALGDVIAALGANSKHVPYRNSKLTFLLQESLSGHSKVLMFVNVSPVQWNAWETLCSLNFAARCRTVALGLAKPATGGPSPSPSATKESSGIPLTSSTAKPSPSSSAAGGRVSAPSPSGKNQRIVYG